MTQRASTLSNPRTLLRWLADLSEPVDRDVTRAAEMWALVGAAALARQQRPTPLADVNDMPSTPFGVHARMGRFHSEEDVDSVASCLASLIAGIGPGGLDARRTLKYVVVELLRNVVQHSGDPLGGVVGAQLNDQGVHKDRPVFQVAVADAGVGVRVHLNRMYPDIEDDAVALTRALWPYVSGAFPEGASGGAQNAGLGLFFISEMAKRLDGRLLVSSLTRSLLVDPAASPREQILDVGFPGTLVAFEIPVALPRDFGTVFAEIGEVAAQRTPKRVPGASLKFVDAPAGLHRLMVSAFNENNDQARHLAETQLIPRLRKREPVVLDFLDVPLCTQSFIHAFLRDALRQAWATETPLYVANANPVVRSALDLVATYALGA